MILKSTGDRASLCKTKFAGMDKGRLFSYKPRWKRIGVAYGILLLMGFDILPALNRAGLLVNSGSTPIDAGFVLWAVGVVIFALWTALAIFAKVLATIGALLTPTRILSFPGIAEKEASIRKNLDFERTYPISLSEFCGEIKPRSSAFSMVFADALERLLLCRSACRRSIAIKIATGRSTTVTAAIAIFLVGKPVIILIGSSARR